jgi:hypothetical protein
LAVAATMSPHAPPPEAHRCHWYVNDVGAFAHVPSLAVSVEPTFGVPPIVGGDVFCGVAALATVARIPVTPAASSATNASFVFLIVIPFVEFLRGQVPGAAVPTQQDAGIYRPFTGAAATS